MRPRALVGTRALVGWPLAKAAACAASPAPPAPRGQGSAQTLRRCQQRKRKALGAAALLLDQAREDRHADQSDGDLWEEVEDSA